MFAGMVALLSTEQKHRLSRNQERAPRPCCYVAIPAQLASSVARLPECATQLVRQLQLTAEILAPLRVQVWLVDSSRRIIVRFDNGEPVALESLDDSGFRAMVNASFLLQDNPPFARLTTEALPNSTSVCASESSRDLYAVAWSGGKKIPTDKLWATLTALTATVATSPEDNWLEIFDEVSIAPNESCEANSPILKDLTDALSKRSSDAPIYVNTALQELMSHPASDIAETASTQSTLTTFLALREESRVPWVFNALINRIEYDEGVVEPNSFPPEIHLSLTGVCNLECRFCAYTNSNAIYKYIDLAKIERLDFLRHVQVLRLSSGLGEPTLNRHLPEIIQYLADKYPHLSLNFFTNAVALNRPGLVASLLNKVRWINVSLNAATAESWERQHQKDHFERVCANLRTLKDAKREKKTIFPLVFSSIVLNGKNLYDLPLMPSLCRSLGIDRLTAFPYSALGYHTTEHTFGAEETLENFRAEYDLIYDETVRQAELHEVSLELPAPSDQKTVRYGLEVRGFYDFARIEKNEWQLGKLAGFIRRSEQPSERYCSFLWRMGCIGSTHKGSRAKDETNYMYPCIGPLSSAELSRATAFTFPGEADFATLWKNPVFKHLRKAQKQEGVCAGCDHCRHNDSRDAKNFPAFEKLVAEFTLEMEALTGTEAPVTIIPIKAVGFR